MEDAMIARDKEMARFLVNELGVNPNGPWKEEVFKKVVTNRQGNVWRDGSLLEIMDDKQLAFIKFLVNELKMDGHYLCIVWKTACGGDGWNGCQPHTFEI